VINTRWRVLRPFVTDPPLPVPDLIEECEEVTFLEVTDGGGRRVSSPRA